MDNTLIAAIDDEALNLEILEFVVKEMDYGFMGIKNSLEAIDRLLENIPQLVLMDVQMPNLDGFALCEKIKQNKLLSDIPIIFLTGMTRSENKVKGFQLGGVDYVTKPFNKLELAARIRTHINLIAANMKIKEQAAAGERDLALKNRLFSIIGHDLRSPLSAVKLQLDFILRGIIDPKDDNFIPLTVHQLSSTTDEAFNLLDNLLGWAKSQSGVLSVVEEKLPIREIIERNIRLVQMALSAKEITLHVDIAENAYVHTDLNMFKTILRNLISNALKFTPRNGSISITAALQNQSWHISVKDSGVGMSTKDLMKLGNTNEHFTTTGTEDEAGTGLGLLLCKDFIERNGGTLSIESEVGVGSTFSFDLPAVL